jgi:hypothetical protein
VVWGLGFLVAFGPLGGSLGYHADLALLTDGGRHLELIGYLWVALLSYFSVKCSVNVGVTNVVAWWMEQRVEEGEGLPEELEGAEVDDEGHFKVGVFAWVRQSREGGDSRRQGEGAAVQCAPEGGVVRARKANCRRRWRGRSSSAVLGGEGRGGEGRAMQGVCMAVSGIT